MQEPRRLWSPSMKTTALKSDPDNQVVEACTRSDSQSSTQTNVRPRGSFVALRHAMKCALRFKQLTLVRNFGTMMPIRLRRFNRGL